MQPMWLCLLTFENTQCRKFKQMQPMWRCNMHPLWQAISGDIWKHTVEKSQTNVTKWLCILTDTQFEYRDKNTQWRKAKINVTLPHLRQAIWKHIAEKSQTNATNVIMPLLRQAIWGHIWKHTAGKSQTNATLYGLRGHIWKCTAEQKSNKCNYCNYASSHAHVLRSHTKKMWWESLKKT
jgi:hypothetical protein